jgi:hypothetical protein
VSFAVVRRYVRIGVIGLRLGLGLGLRLRSGLQLGLGSGLELGL